MQGHTISKAPVIIVGMHRSGTSMLTKLLQDIGLFIGWEHDTHNEAIFFRDRNEAILNAYGGSWDNPEDSCKRIFSSDLKSKIINKLKQDVKSYETLSYLGLYKYLKYRSLLEMKCPWGWKDPRNGLLLPFWLEVFPNAKIINIIRNPVDVAVSLSVREHKNIEDKLKSSAFTLRNFLGALKRQKSKYLLGSALLLYKEKLWRSIGSSKYSEYGISHVIDIVSGVDLWEQYLQITSSHIKNFNISTLNVRYEDILEDPIPELTKILNYCNITKPYQEEFEKIVRVIKQANVYKFKTKQNLVDIHNSIKDSALMRKYNHHQI